jgi:site-specific recombinase XerD
VRGSAWRVAFTPEALVSRPNVPDADRLTTDWPEWLRRSDTLPGTPFLIGPSFDYDIELNAFFCSAEMQSRAHNTQAGYARDLAAFLNFTLSARDRCDWRDVDESDHVAYWRWRRMDPDGPQVKGATWDREVAAADKFFQWQVDAGRLLVNPVPHRVRRIMPIYSGYTCKGSSSTVPATYSHDRESERVEWLPPESYRRWRDVGLRGYGADGLPDSRFRGRWAARNATFCDLMVRTGLRLSEQASLTVFEVPQDRGLGGYQRFWLPTAIAKGRSARWVYVPESVVADLVGYAVVDRAEVIELARAAGRYDQVRNPVVVQDPNIAVAVQFGSGVRTRVKVANLGPAERRRLLVDGPNGLEPASFWLSELGTPLAISTWKDMFASANKRCGRAGIPLTAHAHLLRHTFAVVTLEQLQRGHIAALGELNAEQRGHWRQIFGDPLDWVRRRLGHRSAVTTQIYLHALSELEMETRMALVPTDWEDPRNTPLSELAEPAAEPTR